MSNEVMILESSLSVRFTDSAIKDLSEQKQALVKFVQSQLRKDVDYGIIPGVKNPSLFKPGAEKLANLFQLGSRIVKTDRQVDIKENFAMISHTVEIFHIPTGKVIAQCEGITNSQEKKWREKTKYVNGQKSGVEPQLVGDVLNTLGKMALKRAYVGAVIMAVGASDFFTQDVEDMPPENFAPPSRNVHAPSNMQPNAEDAGQPGRWGYTVPFGKYVKRTLDEIDLNDLRNYVEWLEKNSIKTGKPLGAVQLEFIDMATAHIVAIEKGTSEKEDDFPA